MKDFIEPQYSLVIEMNTIFTIRIHELTNQYNMFRIFIQTGYDVRFQDFGRLFNYNCK